MQTINITEFRSNLLHYLKQAGEGQTLEVTSAGKVLATVSAPPNQQNQAKAKLAKLATTAKIGDVVAAIDEQWDASK